MLYQKNFYTGTMDYSEMLSDVSVKLHGIVMHEIDEKLAAKYHEQGHHPFSVFAVPADDKLIIRVSALNEEALDVLEVFSRKNRFEIYGMNIPLVITDESETVSVSADDISSFAGCQRCRINFVTPATYKERNGKQQCRPELEKYFFSVIKKFNAYENTDISYEEFTAALKECEYQNFSFQTYKYNITSLKIRGLTGQCDMKLPADHKQQELLLKVFQYASFCGAGGKTTMGMGGFTVAPLISNR